VNAVRHYEKMFDFSDFPNKQSHIIFKFAGVKMLKKCIVVLIKASITIFVVSVHR